MDWLIKDTQGEVLKKVMSAEDEFGANAFATAAACDCKAAT